MITIDPRDLDKSTVLKWIVDRFWSHVDLDTSKDGCWLWRNIPTNNYPSFSVIGEVSITASHMALMLSGKPKPDTTAIACHTCDVRACVRPSHLYWGTAKTNSDDAYSRNRHPTGSNHPNAKLTEEKVLVIRELLANKVQHKVIAARMGVHPGTITAIARGDTWKSTLPKDRELGIDTLHPDGV